MKSLLMFAAFATLAVVQSSHYDYSPSARAIVDGHIVWPSRQTDAPTKGGTGGIAEPTFGYLVVDARANGVKCDGRTDDAPALQTLANRSSDTTATIVQLPSGTCNIASAILITKPITLRGQGWSENGPGNYGTYLAVVGIGFTPFEVTGKSVRGSVMSFQNLAVSQLHPVPAAGWIPLDYPYVFYVHDTGGTVNFDKLFLYGINKGISSYNVGRLHITNLYGQVFSNVLKVDRTMDIDRYVDFHIWPFWSSDVNVIAYQQANMDAIWLLRDDSPYLDRIFIYAARSGIRFSQGATGAPSKVVAGSLTFDGVQRGLWLTDAVNLMTTQIGNMTWQGGAGIAPTAPISGATGIQADAGTWGVIQLGNLEAQFGDKNIVNLAGTTSRTILTIGSLYALSFVGGPTRSWLYAANVKNAPVHEISIATLPILAPTSRSLLINQNTNAILRCPGQDYEVVGGPFTSGSSYAMTGVTPKIIMADTSYGVTYPAMTFVFPTQPYDGMEVQLTLENFGVSKATFSGGTTVLAPSTIPLGATVRFKWNLNGSGVGSWLRVQ